MTEYTNLIKALRDCSTVNSLSHYKRGLMAEAADAIEGLELSCKNFEDALKDAVDELEKVERKKGKWQITDAWPHNVYCSECHKKYAQTHWAVWEDGSLPRNFCPNCGTDMRDDDDIPMEYFESGGI